jgi:putative membrane protein insertion efficiency factor
MSERHSVLALRLAGLVWRLPQRLLMLLVRGYRLLLKPWLGNACRFEPTCSAYTLQALQQHGAVGGSVLGGWRLLRCHPWCHGGWDPVPDTFAPWRSRLWRRASAAQAVPEAPVQAGAAQGLFSSLLNAEGQADSRQPPDPHAERPLP